MPQPADTLTEILGVSMDAVVVIDHNGTIEAWNDRAERLFGWSGKDAIGKPLTVLLVPERYREQHRSGMARFLATGVGQFIGKRVELSALHKSGHEIPVEIGVMATTILGAERFMGFLRDLTETEEAKSKIAALKLELDHATRVNAMGTIAAMIAHELNQPLTAAANYLAVTQKLLTNEANSSDVEFAIAQSREAIFRAGETVRSVRELVGRSRPATAPFSLVALVKDVVGHAPQAMHCEVEIDIPVDATRVMVNRMQIEQVLFNLMVNACEAMDGHDDPVLTISSRPTASGMIEVRVRDTGCGIPDATYEALFSPFSSTTKSEGLGLGLSICRTIVEQHHGKIWATREPGATSFYFTLPAADSIIGPQV